MSRAAFHEYFLQLEPHMTRGPYTKTEYRCETIRTDVRVAITSRVLEGGEVLDVALTYSIARGTVYNILHSTVHVLDKDLQFYHLARSQTELSTLTRGITLSRSQLNQDRN